MVLRRRPVGPLVLPGAAVATSPASSFDDRPLGAPIGLGNQVGVALVGNVRRPGKLLAKDLPSLLGDFDGGFKIVFGHEDGWR